ncbi:DUF6415 family natural product biosynthesis protein [Streptomyces sp. ODS05-4]|uniref:DUF6415 family natural product biosynthesis protein n=1 Tax=Streptomyces sp. ODS05-4 TaxID=2944939 RepID=UPI0021088720|nr:DUF6415 family natural product biosynthesis protein [Streptomyces sp. ODS05-4]
MHDHKSLSPPTAPPLGGSVPVDVATLRVTAGQALAAGAGTPGPGLSDLSDALRGHVQLLVPEVRALARELPAEDAAAQAAKATCDEAWRRLHTPRGFGPDAAWHQARRLARSVQSLCDHYETLNPPVDADRPTTR